MEAPGDGLLAGAHHLVIYHCQEDAELWVHINLITVSEYEYFLSFFLTREHHVNLLCSH